MEKQYAVADAQGKILFQTPGFDAARADCAVPLSDGASLLLSGAESPPEEVRALQAQLEEAKAANAAKEIFLSNMSHDIRTPMNAIVGMTALAKKHIDEKKRVADALDKIETASAHLLSLINDVLDMSRINSGRIQIVEERFSISDLLHDILTIIRPQMEAKNHTWQLTAENIEAETLYGDTLRLRQVYMNVVSNAIKYTEAGGVVDLLVSERIEGERCRVIFRCRDNGIGMSPEFVQRIFEPFERASNSTMSKIEGTGLGMSIVKKLVEAMGGEITVESRVGEGTLVTVSVPMAYEREQADTSALADKRLLILEADEKLRARYTRYLGEFGLEYRLVSSAGEALDALTEADFRQQGYSAVLIGSRQENSGSVFDIAAYLSKAYPVCKIVLVSDDNWEQIEYQAMRSGIAGFIPLPFFRKSLLSGLDRLLREEEGAESAAAYPDLAGRRILLAEDNMINREIAREMLSVTGAEIDAAEDGRQAVDMYLAAEEGAYSIILMDVQMPVMDGYAATRAIRASGRGDAALVPIFAMTANTFAEDIARAREAGMNGHIAKPVDVNLLMQALRQARP